MKKLYLIGNHKMNLNRAELEIYLKQLVKCVKGSKNQIGVAVSSPYLYLAEKYLKKSKVLYGAEDCHYEEKGAFTGETGIAMLKDFNCKLCIVGHSEVRSGRKETNENINLKIKSLLKEAMTPVFCFGETMEERNSGLTKKVIKTQLEEALRDISRDEIKKMIFAYEPVWAISTNEGVKATPKQVEEIAKFVKEYISKMYDITEGEIILIYGGSVNPDNANEIFAKTHVDGGLIGGACLNINTFKKLINVEIED